MRYLTDRVPKSSKCNASVEPVSLGGPETLTKRKLIESYRKLPLVFEANQGQVHLQAKFLSRGGGYSIFLSPTETVFSLSKTSRKNGRRNSLGSCRATDEKSTTLTSVIRMKFLGATREPRIEGCDELPGKSNYFIGNDPEKWRSNIPSYASVKYKELYRGVDLVYYGDQRQVEYDFVVAPGTNPGVIRLAFKGVRNTRLDARGDLVLGTGGGEIRQKKPVIYQEEGGAKQYVEGRISSRAGIR